MRGSFGWLVALALLVVLVLLLAEDERGPRVDTPTPVDHQASSRPGLAPGSMAPEAPPRPPEAQEGPDVERGPPASPSPPSGFHVEVQDEHGRPLPASRIEREADISRVHTLPARMHWVDLGVTNDHGVLAIDIKTIRHPLPVRIHHPGHVTTVVRLTRGEPRVVQLAPGRALDGDVREHGSDAPVEGAVVRAYDPRAEDPYAVEVGTPASSGPSGQFRLEGLPDVTSLLLVASKGSWRPGRTYVQESWPVAVRVRMGGAGRVEGRVTTASGEPASDVRIWLLPARIVGAVANRLPWFSVPRGSDVWALGREPASPGPDGGYRFEGVDPEEPWVVLVARERALLVKSKPFAFDAAAPTHREDVVLPAQATVRVRIEDAEGNPLQGVQINLMTPRGTHPVPDREALPFEDGATVFHDVAPGRYEVQAFPSGTQSLREDIDVVPGADVTVRLTVPQGEQLEGTVVYASGEAAVGASVGWYRGGVHASGDVDDQGRFLLTGLPALPGTLHVGNDMSFEPSARLHRGHVEVEDVTPGGPPLRIVLGPLGTLRGHLAGGWSGRAKLHTFTQVVSGGGSIDVGEDGSFELGAPDPPLPALIVLDHPDGRRAYIDVPQLASGADLDVGTVHFTAGGEWRGIVRDHGGDAIAGARILLTERWFENASTTSDERGAFRFGSLPARPVWVRIEVPGRPTTFDVVDIQGQVTQRDLYVPEPGTLQCRVVDATGQPVEGGQLMLRPDVEHPLDRDLDHHRFHVGWPGGASASFKLAPGVWRVRYDPPRRAHERREAHGTFEIRAGQTTEVALTLPSP